MGDEGGDFEAIWLNVCGLFLTRAATAGLKTLGVGRAPPRDCPRPSDAWSSTPCGSGRTSRSSSGPELAVLFLDLDQQLLDGQIAPRRRRRAQG
jgi:hypothetical protein